MTTFAGLWHGRAEAAEEKKPRFCIVVPPERSKAANEPERYAAAATSHKNLDTASRTMSFFRGQMKKVAVGLPDCFRIDAEENALKAAVNSGPESESERLRPIATSSVFPTVGYFNRMSRDDRNGLAFGAGLGRSGSGEGEEEGSPDARVGIVFGFSF